jgi:hypothetical protein
MGILEGHLGVDGGEKKYVQYNVTHIPIARQRLCKQARNKYATNNRVGPLLGNVRNNRTGITGGVFYVGPRHAHF